MIAAIDTSSQYNLYSRLQEIFDDCLSKCNEIEELEIALAKISTDKNLSKLFKSEGIEYRVSKINARIKYLHSISKNENVLSWRPWNHLKKQHRFRVVLLKVDDKYITWGEDARTIALANQQGVERVPNEDGDKVAYFEFDSNLKATYTRNIQQGVVFSDELNIEPAENRLQTPAHILELVRACFNEKIQFDPTSNPEHTTGAETSYDQRMNCLIHSWIGFGNAYMFPPSQNIHKYIDKLCDEVEKRNVLEAIVLLKDGLIDSRGTAVCHWRHSLNLINPDTGKPIEHKNCVFVYFGDCPDNFVKVFGEYGAITYLKSQNLINPFLLREDSLNLEIYGKYEIQELEKSIARHGILEEVRAVALTCTLSSGHRRTLSVQSLAIKSLFLLEIIYSLSKSGATQLPLHLLQKLQLHYIPVKYVKFNSRAEQKRALIDSNLQRPKTLLQKYNEAKEYETIEAEESERRRKSGLKQNSSNPSCNQLHNEKSVTGSRTRDELREKKGTTRDIVAAKFGLGSGENYRRLSKVMDAVKALEKVGNSEKAEQLIEVANKNVAAAYKAVSLSHTAPPIGSKCRVTDDHPKYEGQDVVVKSHPAKGWNEVRFTNGTLDKIPDFMLEILEAPTPVAPKSKKQEEKLKAASLGIPAFGLPAVVRNDGIEDEEARADITKKFNDLMSVVKSLTDKQVQQLYGAIKPRLQIN